MNQVRNRPFHLGFGALGILLAIASAIGLLRYTDWSIYSVWLVAAGIATFSLFGMDKGLAKLGRGRIPELVLHLFGLAGGFVGGWLGMWLFRHKTNWREHYLFPLILIAATVLHGAIIFQLWRS